MKNQKLSNKNGLRPTKKGRKHVVQLAAHIKSKCFTLCVSIVLLMRTFFTLALLLVEPSSWLLSVHSEDVHKGACDCMQQIIAPTFRAAPCPYLRGQKRLSRDKSCLRTFFTHVLYASVWRTSWRCHSCWAASALCPCGRVLSSSCPWPRSPDPSPAYSAACYPEENNITINYCQLKQSQTQVFTVP